MAAEKDDTVRLKKALIWPYMLLANTHTNTILSHGHTQTPITPPEVHVLINYRMHLSFKEKRRL